MFTFHTTVGAADDFLRKTMFLKMNSFISPLLQFPCDKSAYAYLVSLLLFLRIHTTKPTGQFLPNLTASLTSQSCKAFQILMTLMAG